MLFKRSSILNYIFILYFSVFQVSFFQEINLMQGYTVIVLLVSVLYVYFNSKRKEKNDVFIFIWLFFSSFIIAISIAFLDFELGSIYRLSVFFLISLIPFVMPFIDTLFVYKRVSLFYFILFILIILDYFAFVFFSANLIWDVIYYLGARAKGPFYDPNFLGFFAGGLLLLEFLVFKRFLYLFIFFIGLIISGSYAAILLTLFSFLIPSSLRYNIIPFLLLIYILLVFFFYKAVEYIFYFFEWSSKWIYFINLDSLYIKYISFYNRLDVVYLALDKILNDPLGYGYKTILNYLPRDTHNSFVGITFEYGIGALMLVLTPYFFLSNRTSQLVFYSFFMAFFINVHYSPFFIMTFLLIDKEFSK